MALIITLVPITSYAKSYVADDSVIIEDNIHSFFNNYFSSTDTYQYFPYECNYSDYNRTCYYGINQDNEYVDISYTYGDRFNYDRVITTGIDENFSVTGNNVIKKGVSINYIILIVLVFFGVIKIVDKLLGGGYRVK